MIYFNLSDCAIYGEDRVNVAYLSKNNYISTENMLPDRRGICPATSLPNIHSVTKFVSGDILLSNIRPYFKKIWLAEYNGGCSNDVLVIRAKNGTDPHFLYYVLSDTNFFYYATATAKGTKMPRGSKAAIMKYLIPAFDLPTQEKIASILSAYDDAIENNNKRIKILEKMAENLYREWFVRMRFPGHETAEYENGLPKGWSVKRMQEFCYVTDGTHDTPQPKTYGIPLVTGKSISNGFIDFSQTYNIAVKDHEAIQKRSGVVTGDIIFSNIGTIGNCCIVDYDREFSVKNAIIFKPNTWAVSVYLYYWLTSSSVKNLFLGQSNGASQQFVGLTYMRRMKIFIPSKHVIESFGKSTRPILEQRKILHRKNASLSYQRNKLLSRLLTVNQNYISGKIK